VLLSRPGSARDATVGGWIEAKRKIRAPWKQHALSVVYVLSPNKLSGIRENNFEKACVVSEGVTFVTLLVCGRGRTLVNREREKAEKLPQSVTKSAERSQLNFFGGQVF